MHKKFEINWTKIKGGCQSGIKVVPHDSKSDLPLKSKPFSNKLVKVMRIYITILYKLFTASQSRIKLDGESPSFKQGK